jgi:hypothetical protein
MVEETHRITVVLPLQGARDADEVQGRRRRLRARKADLDDEIIMHTDYSIDS